MERVKWLSIGPVESKLHIEPIYLKIFYGMGERKFVWMVQVTWRRWMSCSFFLCFHCVETSLTLGNIKLSSDLGLSWKEIIRAELEKLSVDHIIIILSVCHSFHFHITRFWMLSSSYFKVTVHKILADLYSHRDLSTWLHFWITYPTVFNQWRWKLVDI